MSFNVRFGDLAKLRRESVKPKDFQDAFYIGLEHIAQETLELTGHGFGRDVDSQKQRFYKGDLLFGKLRPYFRKVVIAPFDGICSTDIWVITSEDGKENSFLKYWMASEDFIRNSTHAAEGSRMPRAQWDWVSKFESSISDSAKRKAIGNILSELDQKIAVNKRIAKLCEQMGELLFNSWFVQFENLNQLYLDGQSAANNVNGPTNLDDSHQELEGLPENWSVKPLTSLAEYRNGLALQKYPCNEGEKGLPVIKIPQLKSGNANGAGYASFSVPDKHVIQDGDIIFSWSGALEVELWAGGPGALNQHLFNVIPTSYPKWFVFFATRSHLDEFRSIAASKATTMGHIQRGHLNEALIAVPPKDVMNSASLVMEPLIDLAISKKVEARTLAVLRDILLEGLVTGRVDVPEELLGK